MDSKIPDNFTGTWVSTNIADTHMRYEQEYLDGMEHGSYRHVDTRTNVAIREGSKEQGLDHGEVVLRNSAGKILRRYLFQHGTGVHYIYTSGDRVGWEIPYVKGKMHGLKRRYEFDKVVLEERYENGVLAAEHKL